MQRILVCAAIVSMIGAWVPAAAASLGTSSTTTYASEFFGYSVRWDSGWRVDQSSVREGRHQDSLLLWNDDLGVGVIFSGMRAYEGNATTCIEDHENQVRTVQYPDHDIVVLTTGFGKPLRNASSNESWTLYQVLDFNESMTERNDAFIGIMLCRTLEADQSVIAIQSALIWSEWDTDLPPILKLMNGVRYPEIAPEFGAFTFPVPNVISPEET